MVTVMTKLEIILINIFVRGLIMNKIESIYKNFKEESKDTIVIIKNGIFYYTYNDDAIILWNLFDYKIKDDNELGFGSNSYSKVLSKLKDKNLSYIVYDSSSNKLDEYLTDNNLYNTYLRISKNKYNDSKLSNNLVNKINLLLEDNKDNYNVINDFLDSLLR